ncbi:MAG: T9SS type A sorting domain-containing protein [Bacteroidales bacterium]|nr:T9SS type A sorting domain-containing protein [Bacteroidales bacterium]
MRHMFYIALFVISFRIFAQNNNIFYGGIASGDEVLCYIQSDAILNNNIFKGGNSSHLVKICTSLSEIPLPITLLYFDAFVMDNKVLIKWATMSEVNNDYFVVERSKNLIENDVVGIVDGKGNSNDVVQYQLFDDSPFYGISYYRLKQVDLNENFSYTDWTAVYFDSKASSNYAIIYYNPSNGEIIIETIGLDILYVEIINELGQIVYRTNQKQFNTEKLSNGIYLIKIIFADKTYEIKKLVIYH